MGSSSHGGERKGQLGPAVTVPMSGTHLKRDEGWDPTVYLLFFLYSRILWDFCGNEEKYVISSILRILKYMIHETVLKFFIGLLTHSLLLIIFRYLRHWL